MAYQAVKSDNRDPITGKPGSHPVGTGIGAAVGATAGIVGAAAMGAATGAALGPLGAIAGAAAGGILGGGIGHGIAEDINPTAEDAYWRTHYVTRDYVMKDVPYETYQPAYLYGVDAGIAHQGRMFDDIEPELGEGWESARGVSNLRWEDARLASRDAFERLHVSNKDKL
jgi:hypothetical protein